MHRYRRARRADEPQGVLAAWGADQYRLGHRAAALRFIRKEVRVGKRQRCIAAETFVHHLDRVLRQWGYVMVAPEHLI